MERQFLPSAAKLTNGFPCRKVYEVYHFETDKPNPLIFDVGANIGLATLYWKRLYPNAKIIAFDLHYLDKVFYLCKRV